jgi:hypothetical protein
MYDNLALLILWSCWLRLGGVQRAEFEMRQVRIHSILCCFCFLNVLLVEQRCYA